MIKAEIHTAEPLVPEGSDTADPLVPKPSNTAELIVHESSALEVEMAIKS
jgi:hypothetical protein